MTTFSGDLVFGCLMEWMFESMVWRPGVLLRGRRAGLTSCELKWETGKPAVGTLQHAPALSILVAKCRFNVPYKAPFEFGLSSQI